MSSKLNNQNISLSKLSNINIQNNKITLSNISNSENKTKKVFIKNEILNNREENLKKKKELFRKIYKACISEIQTKYKLVNQILFTIPITFLSELYNWTECRTYLISKLHKNNFNVNYKNNLILISWEFIN